MLQVEELEVDYLAPLRLEVWDEGRVWALVVGSAQAPAQELVSLGGRAVGSSEAQQGAPWGVVEVEGCSDRPHRPSRAEEGCLEEVG